MRQKPEVEESTRLGYTGLWGGQNKKLFIIKLNLLCVYGCLLFSDDTRAK